PRLDATEVAAAKARPRLQIVEAEVPPVAALLHLHRRDGAVRQAELGRERDAVHLYLVDGVQRQFYRVFTGNRIGAERVAQHQRHLAAARATDADLSIGPSHDAGDQR